MKDKKLTFERTLETLYQESKQQGQIENPSSLTFDSDLFSKTIDDIDFDELYNDISKENKTYVDSIITQNKLENIPYIEERSKVDIENLTDLRFVQKVLNRTLLRKTKQIESGDNTRNSYDSLLQVTKEIRENIKYKNTLINEIENTYNKNADIKKSLPSGSIENVNDIASSEGTQIVTTNNLDDLIEKMKKEKNKTNT